MLALLLVAVSLGLSNFAASVGIGVAGLDGRTRLRVGLVFGAFETAMPIIGLLLGHGLAGALGRAAPWIGAGLLIATGLYALVQARGGAGREADAGQAGTSQAGTSQVGANRAGPAGQAFSRLLVTGLALSIDNLAVGFALGAYRVSFTVAAIVIGAVSVALSLLGLEIGARIGTRAGDRGEIIGGVVLIGVGIAIAAGVI
jgi:manganese efflux pump family protein